MVDGRAKASATVSGSNTATRTRQRHANHYQRAAQFHPSNTMNKHCHHFGHDHLQAATIHWISPKVLLILLGLLCTLMKAASSEAQGHPEVAEWAATINHTDSASQTTTEKSHAETTSEPISNPETLGNLAGQPIIATDPSWPEHM